MARCRTVGNFSHHNRHHVDFSDERCKSLAVPLMRRMTAMAYLTLALAFAVAQLATPAAAQFHWPSDAPIPDAPVGSISKGVVVPGPSVIGNWSGQLTQVGGQTPYKIDLTIEATGGRSKYPELKCEGKLNKIGASKSYAFYIEVISSGRASKGGRCPDGTLTVGKAGKDLALVWFGSPEGNLVVAYGTLSKK